MSAKKKSSKGRRPPSGAGNRQTAVKANSKEPPKAQAPRPQKERARPTRAERLAAAEAARRRRTLRTRAVVAGVVVAVLVAITLAVVANRRSASELERRLEAGGCELDSRADADAGLGRNHVPSPTYRVNPPAGGDHSDAAAPPGVYTAADAPPDGEIVHAMEHGYVILWHAPDLAPDQGEGLRALAERYDRDVLMVPRAGMDVPVAATAWHRRLLCDGPPDVTALERFITEFRNQGPEKVPH